MVLPILLNSLSGKQLFRSSWGNIANRMNELKQLSNKDDLGCKIFDGMSARIMPNKRNETPTIPVCIFNMIVL